jgi:hypothetical protein
MPRPIALACALFLVTAPLAAQAPRAALETLSGTYASPAPEPWYGGYGTRRFTFENGQWSLVFTHALDPQMQRPTFRFRTLGPYRIGAESAAVPGAFEGVFFEDAKFVTLLTEDPNLIRAFGFSDCNLRPNQEVDISLTGCANWKPVAQCREDHDLVAFDPTGLRFGVRRRDNDHCTAANRPTALLPAVVRQ